MRRNFDLLANIGTGDRVRGLCRTRDGLPLASGKKRTTDASALACHRNRLSAPSV